MLLGEKRYENIFVNSRTNKDECIMYLLIYLLPINIDPHIFIFIHSSLVLSLTWCSMSRFV